LSIPKFFTANIDNPIIEKEEFYHLRKVLRKKEGDEIKVLNGNGIEITGIIKKIHKDFAEFKPEKIIKKEKPVFSLNINIAFLPSDKLNFIIQKLTEIGVSKINIFPSIRSKINKITNNIMNKEEKLRKVAISAIKQSGNLFLPQITITDKFDKILKQNHNYKILLSQSADYLIKSDMFKCENNFSISLSIGAEGGFTLKETEMFEKNGFIKVKINENTLRAETAAIGGALLIKYFMERQCF
jgi:16S rRNA (uracil1498-N3)-methyltransferase